jgi:hypothetical protein
MQCWRGKEKISRADRVRNKVLQRVKEERNILQAIKRKEGRITGFVTSCAGTAFLNTLFKETRRGRIEVTGKRGRRRKNLLDDLKENKDV